MTLPAAPNKLGIIDALALEVAEGDIASVRIAELEESPIVGNFDVAHLKSIHQYIFQDVYDHAGQFHETEIVRIKTRVSEVTGEKYAIYYPSIAFANCKLDEALKSIVGQEARLGRSQADVADQVTAIYMAVDYAHPFHEGNSRTLREFTSMFAKQCGYALDWGTSNVNGVARDQLYAARDKGVLKRVIDDVQTEQQMFGISRTLYKLDKLPSLRELIEESLTRLHLSPNELYSLASAESVRLFPNDIREANNCRKQLLENIGLTKAQILEFTTRKPARESDSPGMSM